MKIQETELVNVESAVRQFLQSELGKDVSRLGSDDSLLETGMIDSVGVMQLVAFLERSYAIKVGDDDLMPDNFDTLTAISTFVASRRGTSD
jgi:acyl carrier protein